VEGILARIIEATDHSADLPVQDGNFLCGMEFASLDEERRFFANHGIQLPDMELEVVLRRGELLIFDNLAVAHGRRGARRTGELSQLCIGYRALDPARQMTLVTRVLSSFRVRTTTRDGEFAALEGGHLAIGRKSASDTHRYCRDA
jgi:hypothetical protein